MYYGYDDIVPDPEHRVRLLNRISACHSRCFNPKTRNFSSYGGRGITVTWGRDRRAFLEYLVTLDGWDDPSLELDRIDVDGPYGPGNLRFATKSENAKNKRRVDAMSTRLQYLESEVRRLRACVRHLTGGSEEQVYGSFG
jgi:hypothetical protein